MIESTDLNRTTMARTPVGDAGENPMNSGTRLDLESVLDIDARTRLNAATPSRRLSYSVTINRPAIALYRAWYDLARRQSTHMNVQRPGEAIVRGQSVIKAPYIGDADGALLVDEIPGVFISWESLPTAPVRQLGEVWFNAAAVEQSTEVRVTLSWKQAENGASDSTEKSLAAGAQLEQDLARFKQLMEL